MKRRRLRYVPFLLLPFALAACSAIEKVASAVSGGSCNGPTTLSATGSASGSTNGQNCKFPDGSTGATYSLTAAQPTNVEVTVTPNGFQAWLGAWTANGTMIAQTNTSPWRHRLFLAPGSYQFGVSAVGSKDGTYTISTSPADVTACKAGPGGSVSGDDNGTAMKGAVITGTITNTDCGGGSYRNDVYGLFGATAGSTWTFTFTADRAADLGVFVGSQQVGAKSLTTAGTTALTVPGSTDFSLRIAVGGTPGTGTINYTVTIN